MDPIHSAMMTVDSTSTNLHTNPMDSVEKYLPEPQSLKAVLILDDHVCTAWLCQLQRWQGVSPNYGSHSLCHDDS